MPVEIAVAVATTAKKIRDAQIAISKIQKIAEKPIKSAKLMKDVTADKNENWAANKLVGSAESKIKKEIVKRLDAKLDELLKGDSAKEVEDPELDSDVEESTAIDNKQEPEEKQSGNTLTTYYDELINGKSEKSDTWNESNNGEVEAIPKSHLNPNENEQKPTALEEKEEQDTEHNRNSLDGNDSSDDRELPGDLLDAKDAQDSIDTDTNELDPDEINKMQISAIKEGIVRILKGEKLTNEELGNLGEMMMDQYYIAKGYTPLNKHRVTSLDDKKEGFKTGLDGVYEKTNEDGTKNYVIADAKYNTSQLADTNDGKQMSNNWIDKRLDEAVGKEKADEIRDSYEDNPDSVKHEVYHIDPDTAEGKSMQTDIQQVDAEGNKTGEKTIVEDYDSEGNRILRTSDNVEE